MQKYKYLLYLNQFYGFGPKRLLKLKTHFPSWQDAFFAGFNQMKEAGIEEPTIERFLAFKKELNGEELLKYMKEQGIKIAVLGEPNYPDLLSEIADPPPLIYYKGDINYQKERSLAVVGARKYTKYGQQIINTIISDLADNGLVIISGLAIGIDSLAHKKALESKTKTIAVLGSGINKIYPQRNFSLAKDILDSGGGIISEFPLNTPPLKQNFPQRNRIISGMSRGTFMVEGRKNSGSLITAYLALEQDREIFAVPGDIDRTMAAGGNGLIKRGAVAVLEADDVLQSLNLEKTKKECKLPDDISENERTVLGSLSEKPLHIEELVNLTKLDTKVINSTLIILEIKKLAKNIGNNRYITT